MIYNHAVPVQTSVTALQVATAHDWEQVGDELAEYMQEYPGQRRISIQVCMYVLGSL